MLALKLAPPALGLLMLAAPRAAQADRQVPFLVRITITDQGRGTTSRTQVLSVPVGRRNATTVNIELQDLHLEARIRRVEGGKPQAFVIDLSRRESTRGEPNSVRINATTLLRAGAAVTIADLRYPDGTRSQVLATLEPLP